MELYTVVVGRCILFIWILLDFTHVPTLQKMVIFLMTKFIDVGVFAICVLASSLESNKQGPQFSTANFSKFHGSVC